MKQESIDRLYEIQIQQFKALEEQDVDSLFELEAEKTLLLQQIPDFSSASSQQQKQLEAIVKSQQDLERICADVRDALGQQIKQVMEKHKAVQAYKNIE